MRTPNLWKLNAGLWLVLVPGLVSVTAVSAQDQGTAARAMNEAPAWMVRVSVDREDREYVVGEDVKIRVVSEQGGYLYLFNIDSSKQDTQLFPNRFQPENRIQASTVVAVPGPVGFRIRVGSRGLGTETLLAVVTKRPLQEMKPEELSREGPTPLKAGQLNRLLAEAILGRPDLAGNLQAAREDLRHRNPEAYARRAREWAEHSIQILTSPARQPSRAQRIGLFVGVSRYPKLAQKSQLHFAHKDAEGMAKLASRVGGFTRTILLTDSNATLENIRAGFKDLVSGTRPGDTVLIYWSGHGNRVETGESARPYIYVLLPRDVDPDTGRQIFHEDEFGRWVQALDGRKVMVIIDACHSGGHIEGAKTITKALTTDAEPRSKGVAPPHFLDTAMLRARSIGQHDAAILTACRLDQTSIESGRLESGLMTFFILQVLVRTSGPLTLRETYQTIDPLVREYMRQNGREGLQTAVFSDQSPRPPALIRLR
jgi:hypothetical protein